MLQFVRLAKPVLVLIAETALFYTFTIGQQYYNVAPGIEHVEIIKTISGLAVRINILRVNPKMARVDVVHAKDAVIGAETTSSISRRWQATAAINGGFFRLDKSLYLGEPAGVLQIDGKLLSDSVNDRAALLINNAGRTHLKFARIRTTTTLILGRKKFRVSGINRELKKDEIIIFTPEFHPTVLSDSETLLVSVSNSLIKRVARGEANFRIPCNGFVIAAKGQKAEEILAQIKKSKRAAVVSNIEQVDAAANKLVFKAEDITNGASLLVKDGSPDLTFEAEKISKSFAETRHPRTAAAVTKNGEILFVTVDGRSESSGGISLKDLADFLISLGAVDAINLDGGGSTTMVIQGKVVNQPSDKEGERAIGDAIIIRSRGRKISN